MITLELVSLLKHLGTGHSLFATSHPKQQQHFCH